MSSTSEASRRDAAGALRLSLSWQNPAARPSNGREALRAQTTHIATGPVPPGACHAGQRRKYCGSSRPTRPILPPLRAGYSRHSDCLAPAYLAASSESRTRM